MKSRKTSRPRHSARIRELLEFVRGELRSAADPKKAPPMAAYMRTTMPFYGVPQPARQPIFGEMKRRFAPLDREEYEATVLAFWNLPRREEKYAAIELATARDAFVILESLPLYERMIRDGAWWDFVDDIARKLVGQVLLCDRAGTRRVLDRWIDDEDMWIRRTAILAQLHHKERTDAKLLFRYCLRRAHEKEFFIRKAIGWALRQYSATSPEAVKQFLLDHRERLSPLSVREGAKRLARAGMWPEEE